MPPVLPKHGCARNDKIVLHQLDPRTKLLLTALLSALVFFIDVLTVAAVQMAVFTGLCLAVCVWGRSAQGRRQGIPGKKIIAYGAFLLPLIALLIGLQILFGQGLFTGLMLGCRVISLLVLMPLLIMTTDMQRLALGITRLGLPYKAAYIITATLNLIPLFQEEARLIMDARRLRMPVRAGAMKPLKLTEYPAIALPLMIKALRQAHLTGLAMDVRAFGAYKTRTWLQEIQFSAIDGGAFAAGIIWAAAAMSANALLK